MSPQTKEEEWFDFIPDKSKTKFIKFDVVNFYPSTSQEFFKKLLSLLSCTQLLRNMLKVMKHV